jgi:hypothetical protein
VSPCGGPFVPKAEAVAETGVGDDRVFVTSRGQWLLSGRRLAVARVAPRLAGSDVLAFLCGGVGGVVHGAGQPPATHDERDQCLQRSGLPYAESKTEPDRV